MGVSRPGQGREPWYLLTTEPIALQDDAWQIILAYAFLLTLLDAVLDDLRQ